MKLTNLHIFLIILLALVLCSTLGGNCGAKEGYQNNSESQQNKRYHRYGGSHGYDKHLDDENTKEGMDDGNGDDLNVGDGSDNSGMYSESNKRHNYKHSDYNNAYCRERQNDNMFDSVSTGSINGSIFTSSNSYNDNEIQGKHHRGKHHGVPRNQIPEGDDDLYILKSQIVPPICPACPKCPSVNCDDKCGSNKCPPCPACARCPEPQFECKKVPNYSGGSLMGNLPIPWADKLDLN
jgi:hypothetical protein